MHFSPSSLVLLGLTVVNLVNGDDIIFNDPKSRVPAVPKILSATASGSGCPQGTTDFLTQPDGVDYLEFMHRNFSAIAGGGAAPRIVSKNCEVHLSLDAGTPGWQAALGKLTVLGEASVAPNATFTAYVTSYWSFTANDRVTQNVSFTNQGEAAKNGNVTVELHTDSEGAWSPCIGDNGNVGIANVNFRVAMTASDTSGLSSFSQRAGNPSVVTERIGWLWRKCKPEQETKPTESATSLEPTSTPAATSTVASAEGCEETLHVQQ